MVVSLLLLLLKKYTVYVPAGTDGLVLARVIVFELAEATAPAGGEELEGFAPERGVPA